MQRYLFCCAGVSVMQFWKADAVVVESNAPAHVAMPEVPCQLQVGIVTLGGFRAFARPNAVIVTF